MADGEEQPSVTASGNQCTLQSSRPTQTPWSSSRGTCSRHTLSILCLRRPPVSFTFANAPDMWGDFQRLSKCMSQLLSASLGQGEGTDREKKKPRRFSKYSTSTKDLIIATASEILQAQEWQPIRKQRAGQCMWRSRSARILASRCDFGSGISQRSNWN